MLPNFLIGGVGAAGTSFLTASLSQHPEIYLPKKMRPEPHYFYKSWEYEKPLSYYEQMYFSDVKDEKAVGERSSSYLFGGRVVAERIHKAIPDVKLIFTVRNPLERTWANYRYTVLEGLEALSFEDVLKQEKERIAQQKGRWAEVQPHNYTGRGFYGQQLSEYLDFFDRSQILVIKSEAMGQDPKRGLQRVFNFLGVDESFQAQMPPNFTSLSVKDPLLQTQLRDHFANQFDVLIEAIRREEPPEKYVSTEEDEAKFYQLRDNVKGLKEPMPESSRKFLQSVFAEDIQTLKPLVTFSVDDWK